MPAQRISALLFWFGWVGTGAVGLTLRGKTQQGLTRFGGKSRQPASPLEWSEHGSDWNDGFCTNRDKASPINFDDFEEPLMLQKNFLFNWQPIKEPLELVNDGITVSVDVSHLKEGDVGGVQYDNGYHRLTRIEFHSGSEHTFKGRHLPLEIQLTHAKKDAKSRIIVSVLVDAEMPEEKKPTALLEKGRGRASRRGAHRYRGAQEPEEQVDLGNPEFQQPSGPRSIVDDPQADEFANEALGKPRDSDMEREEDEDEITEIGDWDKAAEAAPEAPSSGQGARGVLAAAPVIRRMGAGPFGLLRANQPGAPAPAPAPAGDVYKPPDMTKPDANALLQNFLGATLPMLDEVRALDFSESSPLSLNQLIGSGKDSTFFEYLGSFTTPPCGGATWLVRRTPIRASTEQAKLFFKTLHTMTDSFGNYRTTMPLNGRVVYVREALFTSTIPAASLAKEQKEDEKRKFVAKQVGEDAKTIADAAVHYAKGLDERLRRAAVAHVLALEPTSPPPPTPPTPGPGLPMAPQWQEPEYVRRAIASSGASHVDEVVKQIAAYASDAAKQAGLEAANQTAQTIYDNKAAEVWSGLTGMPVPTASPPAPTPTLSPAAMPAAAPGAPPPWLVPQSHDAAAAPVLARPPGSWSNDVMDATKFT